MGHIIRMQSLQQHNPLTSYSVSGIQSSIIATYLPSTAYNDLLQVHITAVVPSLHQDQEINSLTLQGDEMIQSTTLEKRNVEAHRSSLPLGGGTPVRHISVLEQMGCKFPVHELQCNLQLC